ncbi:MAG: hypothetical protein AAGF83_02660 [Cyanobacteria bacterium P01_G01_bin.67]
MPLRLNNKGYEILAAAIKQAAAKDPVAGEVSQKVALKRIQQLNSTKGTPVTEAELKDLISDLFLDFDSKAAKKEVRVNRSPSTFWWMTKIALGLGSLSGLRMDRNYRQAIAKVEQADQLVNRATSLEDLKLGQEKVNQAQQNLDALPVWFLGYELQMYRTFFSFGWKFTLDEFEAARAKVGRMDAKIFQEINAFTKLEHAKQEIQQAKLNYQQSKDTTAKQQAISTWQAGLDQLNQLPARTLAKEQAAASYDAYLRDFRQVSGLVAGNDRTNKIIAVALKLIR